MKYATVAMIAWLVAVGGVCLGEPAENRLEVTAHEGKMTARSTLMPGANWRVWEGEATVQCTDSKLKLPPKVHYSIKGERTGNKLLTITEFAYKKPIQEESELTLSGIQDAAKKNVTFKGTIAPALEQAAGQTTSHPQSQEGETAAPGAGTTGAGQPVTTGVPVTQLPGQSLLNGSAQSSPSLWQRVKSNLWLLTVLAFCLLSLVLCFSMWRAVQRTSRRYRVDSSTEDMARQSVDLGPVSEKARTALEEANEAKRQAKLVREEVIRIAGRLEAALEDLKALQSLDLRALVSERKTDLQHLGRVLQDLAREPQPAVEQSSMAQSKREEAAAPAIVNRWLGEGGRDRDYLMTMANDLGVRAQLMNHKDLNLVFQDLTTFEYPFEEDANGPWFWVAIEGSTEFWAVPADAVFFGMGRAPSLVERLFDGMQGVSQGFQFRAIYRACRLKPVAGRSGVYSVVSRGLLQLEGAAEPKVARPLSFEELLPPRPVPVTANASGQSVGKQLAAWMQAAGQQELKMQEDVRRLVSEVSALKQKVNAPSPGEEQLRRHFNAHIVDLKQKVKQLESELRQRGTVAAVAEKAQAVEPPAAPGATEIPAPATSLAEQETPPVRESLRGQTAVADEMPDGWQEALRRAAALPASEPELVEVPREDLYVQRVRNLAAELQELDASRTVSVVHLMVGQQGNTFEVHETTCGTGHAQEPVMCLSCYTAHTWQLAVCVGARAAAELFVLYPLGGFNKSKYPSGYARLIANPPAANISEIEYPARLQRVAEAAPTYVVARKMQLTGNEAER